MAPRLLTSTFAAAALWVASTTGAAQQPDTRLIDTEPKVVIRPPADDPVRPRGGAIPPADPGREADRDLDLELEMEERRERRDGGSAAPSWLAALIFVAAGGVMLVIVRAMRRRDHR